MRWDSECTSWWPTWDQHAAEGPFRSKADILGFQQQEAYVWEEVCSPGFYFCFCSSVEGLGLGFLRSILCSWETMKEARVDLAASESRAANQAASLFS